MYKIKKLLLILIVNTFTPRMEELPWQKKMSNFARKNMVILVMGPLIIGLHWGWQQLQNDERFVGKHERRELPIVEVFNRFSILFHLVETIPPISSSGS